MATKIKMSDVKVGDDHVTVHGAGGTALATSLIQKNSTTMGELSEKFGLVQPHEISLGSDGSVKITNAKLANNVRGLVSRAVENGGAGFFDTNCGCGGGSGGGSSSW